MFQMMLYQDKWAQSRLSFAGTANNLGHYPKSNGAYEGFEQQHHMSRVFILKRSLRCRCREGFRGNDQVIRIYDCGSGEKTVAWMRMVRREEAGFQWRRRDMVRLQILREYKRTGYDLGVNRSSVMMLEFLSALSQKY